MVQLKDQDCQLEQDSYQNSLKYYRDLNNVVDTSRQEGRQEGLQEGLIKGQRSLLLRQLSHQLGELPDTAKVLVNQLSLENLEFLSEELFEFKSVDDLMMWLNQLSC